MPSGRPKFWRTVLRRHPKKAIAENEPPHPDDYDRAKANLTDAQARLRETLSELLGDNDSAKKRVPHGFPRG